MIAGQFDGKTIQLDEIHRFPNGPVSFNDTLRWDVIRLWGEIQQGLSKSAVRFGQSITSVGVDTWGVDYVLLTATGEMLGAPYNYRDARTRGRLNETLTRVPKAEIFAQTGLQFMEINTLYQLLAMKATNPRLLDVADRFLMMPDFFHWLLCGSKVVEFTNATTTQCLHPTQRKWANELLLKLGLPTHIFPEIVQPGTLLGRLREDVARRTGLPRLNVIAPPTHDTGAAIAAVPTELTGTTKWAYISSGTWSLMGIESPEAALGSRALEMNVTNEGGVDGTYRVLKNIMGLWLVQECRRAWDRQGQAFDYALLTQMASDSPPFRALVDPDAADFMAPDDMPSALRNYCRSTNQEVPETEGSMVRMALESLAMKYRMVLTWLEELSGQKVEVIHIVGGGCQNELLNQFTANACGRPVVAGPVEATALGNVLMQARTSGQISSLAEIRQVVRASFSIKRYEPQNQAAWQDAYGRFVEIIKRPR